MSAMRFIATVLVSALSVASFASCDDPSDPPPPPSGDASTDAAGAGGSAGDASAEAETSAGGTDAGPDVAVEGAAGTGGASVWAPVGGKLDHDTSSCCHTFDPTVKNFGGKPVVVWAEDDPTSGSWVRLKSWEGAAWQSIESPSQNDVEASPTHRSPAVTLLGSKLLVGWNTLISVDGDGLVRGWDGTSWSAAENVTPVQTGDSQDWGWGLSLASGGTEAHAVYIARLATDSSQRFKHRITSGSGFSAESEIGSFTEAYSTRAAVSDDGTKKCFIRETGGVGAYVLDVFVDGALAATPPGLPSAEHLEYDVVVHDAAPVVAMVADGKVSVARLNGAVWENLGAARLNADPLYDGANDPSLHSFGGKLYLSWSEKGDQIDGGVFVRRWDSGAWVDLGSNIVIDPTGTRQTQDSNMQVIGTDLFLAFTELKSGVYSLWVIKRPL
ncbi:MAG: hypothetical protein HY898_26735 [Deltaproteobacteria bacterium]|nr:hypothetical protein [Deltaproteobacteria bacterium]